MCVNACVTGEGGSEVRNYNQSIEELGKEICPDLPKGLMDKHATASQLFEALATSIKNAMEKWVCNL